MAGREQPVWAGVPGYPGGGSDWLLPVRGGGSCCATLRRLGHACHTGNPNEGSHLSMGNPKENGVKVGVKDMSYVFFFFRSCFFIITAIMNGACAPERKRNRESKGLET